MNIFEGSCPKIYKRTM